MTCYVLRRTPQGGGCSLACEWGAEGRLVEYTKDPHVSKTARLGAPFVLRHGTRCGSRSEWRVANRSQKSARVRGDKSCARARTSAPHEATMSQTTATAASAVRNDVSLLTDNDLYLFNEGSHYRIYDKMGAHHMTAGGEAGTCFSVWAPNAREVSVIGSFNQWHPKTHLLHSRGSSGIWEGFIPGANKGALYKFHIESHHHGHRVDKADPIGLLHEKAPRTASVGWELDYSWGERKWMKQRADRNSIKAPMSIYEVHIGSWMRVSEE